MQYRRIADAQETTYVVVMDEGDEAMAALSSVARVEELAEGYVWPTLEIVVRDRPAQLRTTMRPEVGLALIDLPRSST